MKRRNDEINAKIYLTLKAANLISMRPIIALSKWGLDEGLTRKVFFLQIRVELSFKIIHIFISYFYKGFELF